MAREPDWDAIKPRYEAGETLDTLAKSAKVPKLTINAKAKREKWYRGNRPKGELKPQAPTRDSQRRSNAVAESASLSSTTLDVPVLDPESYLEQHRDDWQGLRLTAIKLLSGMDHLDPKAQARQLSAIATALKLVQDGQRKHFGVDKGDPAPQSPEQQAMMYVPPDSQDWRAYADKGKAE